MIWEMPCRENSGATQDEVKGLDEGPEWIPVVSEDCASTVTMCGLLFRDRVL